MAYSWAIKKAEEAGRQKRAHERWLERLKEQGFFERQQAQDEASLTRQREQDTASRKQALEVARMGQDWERRKWGGG